MKEDEVFEDGKDDYFQLPQENNKHDHHRLNSLPDELLSRKKQQTT